ncbi:hypothetical protein SLA2020_257690 [Shorea laevis]
MHHILHNGHIDQMVQHISESNLMIELLGQSAEESLIGSPPTLKSGNLEDFEAPIRNIPHSLLTEIQT